MKVIFRTIFDHDVISSRGYDFDLDVSSIYDQVSDITISRLTPDSATIVINSHVSKPLL